MDKTKLNFDLNLKDSHLQLVASRDEYTCKTKTSRNTPTMLYSTLNSFQKNILKDAEQRRKTLIIAATSSDISECKQEAHDDNKIDHVEEVELVEEATQVEQELLNCYKLSSHFNPQAFCKMINEENDEAGNCQQQLPYLFVKKSIQSENTSLDLYKKSLDPTNKVEKDDQQNKEEKQLEDNIQGSTGLALLAHSNSVSPRSTPKTITPRLNVEKNLIEQSKLMVPTTYFDQKIKNNVESKKGDYGCQAGIELQCNSSITPLYQLQSIHKTQNSNDLFKHAYTVNSICETSSNGPLDTIATTISSTNEKAIVGKDMKLKLKTCDHILQFKYEDNILNINDNNLISRSLALKTPQEISKSDLEFQKKIQFDNGKKMQVNTISESSQNEGDRLALESINRDCKEWFQEKLWCYLFENLSRAIDELYFLCDLQGASEKIDEAILFLEEANQDFKELKSCFDASIINGNIDITTNMNELKSHINEGHSKIQSNEKKIDIQSNNKRIEYNTTEEFDPSLIEKEIKFQIVEEKNKVQNIIENYQIQSNDHKHHISEIIKQPPIQSTRIKSETTIEHQVNDQNHNIQVIEEKFDILATIKELEIEINEMKLDVEANKRNKCVFDDKDKTKRPCEAPISVIPCEIQIPNVLSKFSSENKVFITSTKAPIQDQFPTTSSEVPNQILGTNVEAQISKIPQIQTFIGDGKNKKHFQSLSWEIPKRSLRLTSQQEGKDFDCRVGMVVNIAQSSFISQPPNISQKDTFEERAAFEALKNRKEGFEAFRDKREGFETFRDYRERIDHFENSQNRAASVIGYRVDEERKKMVEFVDNDVHKQKPNKKASRNTFTGRLMRPTESSNIRSADNIKAQEKGKSKNKAKNETWSLTTKCHNDWKQKGSWLDALATPQRGPSRCQDFDKPQNCKKLDSLKSETIQQNSSKKSPGDKFQLILKKVVNESSKESPEKNNVESHHQKQEKSNYKLNQGKLNKSMVEYISKKTISKVHEYDIRHVEQRLAERLKEGAHRRLACVEKIKGCVRLISEEDKQNKLYSYDDFWHINSYKKNKIVGNVEDVHTHFIGISFFQKQAMRKRVKNIRLKLINKKIELPKHLLEIECAKTGSATATGLAKARIGKWMEELRRVQLAKDIAQTTSVISEIANNLNKKNSELHVARQLGLLDFAATSIPLRQDPTITLSLLQIQKTLLCLPANRSYFIIQNLLPPMVPMLLSSLEIFSTYGNFYQESDSKSSNEKYIHQTNNDKIKNIKELDVLQEILEGLLNSTICIMGHSCLDDGQLSMQDDLADLLVASGLIHQLQNFFAIFNWQQNKKTPIPNSIILSLTLMEVLTGSKRKSLIVAHEEPISILIHKPCIKEDQYIERKEDSIKEEGTFELASMDKNYYKDTVLEKSRKDASNLNKETPRIVITQKASSLAESTTLLIAAISETGLVGLPALLIGIVLEVNPFLKEETKSTLPSNFNEVAIILLQVLNNVARLDLSLIQNKLALPDVCMEFYQLVGFFLTYCTSNWKSSVDEIATLLLETMMFIGYAALLHPQNQAILQWGKNPTILQKMCNLPFVFFSDSKLTPILIGTLLAVCYGSDINRDVVQQQLSMEILLTFLKSSKTGLFHTNSSDNIKAKEELKDFSQKTKTKVIKGFKNDEQKHFDIQRCTQRIFLPKSLFSPSKNMLAIDKFDTFLPSPSTPKTTRQREVNFCSTTQNSMATSPHTQCSRLCRSLDSFDGTSSSINGTSSTNVSARNVMSPKFISRDFETNDGSSNEVVDEPLPIAFALQNRFPEGLWNYAEEFFSSSTWMGQLVKCL